MSVLDEFRQQHRGKPGPSCGVPLLMMELGTDEADKLAQALDAPWQGRGAVAHTQISEWLREKHGVHYAASSIGRHRRAIHGAPGARCSCGR